MKTTVNFKIDWEDERTNSIKGYDVNATIQLCKDMYATGNSPTGLELQSVEVLYSDPNSGVFYDIDFEQLPCEVQAYIEDRAIEEVENQHLQETFFN